MTRNNDSKYTQKDLLLLGIIGFLLGAIAAWIFIINSVNTNNLGLIRMMGMQRYLGNTTQNSNSIDSHFIEQMIPHHEDAITMAKLAETKAKRSEVKQLSLDIIDSQGREIDQMKAWYVEWYGKEVPQDEKVMGGHGMQQNTKFHMGMMGNDSDIASLEQAEDFDRAFVEEMIPHHQMAVMMATMLKNGTSKPEMSKLADDIITAQTEEIDQMRSWLKEWEN